MVSGARAEKAVEAIVTPSATSTKPDCSGATICIVTDSTLQDLCEAAVRESADPHSNDGYWSAVRALHARPHTRVFEWASILCRSPHPHERSLGLDVLAQLGSARPFRDVSVPVVLATLEDPDPYVLQSAVIALGHLEPDDQVVEAIIPLKDHPLSDVRFGVSWSLGRNRSPAAIGTLIELSHDVDDEVRDWSTFCLGVQTDADSPLLREALATRLSDVHDATRLEAIGGLARRKDPRALEPLLRELSGDAVYDLALEAAADLGDPRLEPRLLAIAEWWPGDKVMMQQALKACAKPDRPIE